MHQILRTVALLVLLASTADFGLAAEQGVSVQPEWASAGQNNHNTRHAATEHTINANNVGSSEAQMDLHYRGRRLSDGDRGQRCRLCS